MGARIGSEEADAVAHLVRAMAWGQGVVPALQVDTHADALALFDRITSLDGPTSPDGVALMDALMDVPHTLARRRRDRLAAPMLRRLYEDIAATTLGPEHAGALGVRRRGTLAQPVRWLARTQLLHHRALVPLHDAMVAGVMARGFRRLGSHQRTTSSTVS